MRGVSKADLPQKTCPACHRPFAWRRKWPVTGRMSPTAANAAVASLRRPPREAAAVRFAGTCRTPDAAGLVTVRPGAPAPGNRRRPKAT